MSKPTSDVNNIFNKFQPQTFVPETKQVPLNSKSNETGEPEEDDQVVKPNEVKKTEKPVAKAFTVTIIPAASGASNVPDVLRSHQQVVPKTDNKNIFKSTEKSDKIKENIPDGVQVINLGESKSTRDMKENVTKPLTVLPTTKSNLTNTNQNISSSNASVTSSKLLCKLL